MQHRVLLVDDEPKITNAIRRLLRSEELKIFEADSGAAGLRILDAEPIDLVISDHRMPEMTGAEFLAEVSDRYPNTIRLMLSGQADMDAVIDAVNRGSIAKFLTKPWSNDALRETVRESLAQIASGKTDADTGWLTRSAFSDALNRVDSPTVAVVVVDLRNTSQVLALRNKEEKRQIYQTIEALFREAFEQIVVPLATIDRGLIAFACRDSDIAERLRGISQSLDTPIAVDDLRVPLDMAFGIASHEPGSVSATIQRAQIAVASARPGVQTVIEYTQGMRSELIHLHSLERDLTAAVRNGEFFLELQPQVATQSLTISGGEALIRWQHPKHGLISPLQFIDMAERNGVIEDIGIWVVEQGLTLLEAVSQISHEPVIISINLSPRQIANAMSSSKWMALLQAFHKRSPSLLSSLDLEITESTAMHDIRHASEVIREVKSLGIRVSLDDFGTGHSSIGQLAQLDIDSLKIDRSLIRHAHRDERSQTLFRHTVLLATELGLETVAEGIENPQQIELCQSLGVNTLQGFGLYKPMPVHEFCYQIEQRDRHD